MINALANQYFNSVKRITKDEYQEQVYIQAGGFGYYLMGIGNVATFAALMWLLPKDAYQYSLLVFVPWLVCDIIVNLWLKARVPRPAKAPFITQPWYYAIMLTLVLVALGGFAYQQEMLVTSYVIGSLIGMGFALLLLLFLSRWQHRRDIERFEHEDEEA